AVHRWPSGRRSGLPGRTGGARRPPAAPRPRARDRTPDDRADSGSALVRPADHGGARAVAQQDAGAPVGPVHEIRHLFGADDEAVPGSSGTYRVVGAGEGGAEARTGVVEGEADGGRDAEAVATVSSAGAKGTEVTTAVG